MATGKDLRKAIKMKDLTMEDAAEALEVSRATVYNWSRLDVLDENILQTVKLKLNIDLRKQPEDASTTSFLDQRRQTKQNGGSYTAPLMPAKAYAGYVTAPDQMQYMETLEKYALPPGISHLGARWAYFEIEGDSMEPTFRTGDVILCSMVHELDWENMRNFYTYVIVTDDMLVIKRVVKEEPGEWILLSDNEEAHKPFIIYEKDVKQLWVFRRHLKRDAALNKKFDMDKIREQLKKH